MNDEKLAELQKSVADLKILMHGDPTTTRGGVAQCVETMGTTLYGKDKIPGLVAEVMQLKKVQWIGIGVLLAAQVGIQILFHFWKP
jgi:hypothetical protein